uniref:Uncharacterized protein n=1 Tax=Anopheles merus TaxID=30066 RepID=A0A182V3I9_ANOME
MVWLEKFEVVVKCFRHIHASRRRKAHWRSAERNMTGARQTTLKVVGGERSRNQSHRTAVTAATLSDTLGDRMVFGQWRRQQPIKRNDVFDPGTNGLRTIDRSGSVSPKA